MNNPLSEAGVFIVQTIFDLYSYVLVIRLLLEFFQGDFYNPVAQFVMRVTSPIVKPITQYVPTVNNFNFAIATLLVVTQMIKLFLVAWLGANVFVNILALLIAGIAGGANAILTVLFYAIIAQVILSWVRPHGGTPIEGLLYGITEPVLRPARRMIPLVGGIDLSPIAVIIVLKLISILIIEPFVRLLT